LKNVAAMTAGKDLRKTCETVRKHKKQIWDRFEGCPFKKIFLVVGCALSFKTEQPDVLCTRGDNRPQSLVPLLNVIFSVVVCCNGTVQVKNIIDLRQIYQI
jgi:hypothetical protein